MKLKIVTPERVVLETEDIEAVFANTIDGEIGILKNHVPLISPLGVGVLRYVKDNQRHPIAVMGGLIRTNGQTVSVLTTAAELASEIDVERAKAAKVRAEAKLQQGQEGPDANAQEALRRAVARLKVKE